jgi:SAM-dependent methyltransferase
MSAMPTAPAHTDDWYLRSFGAMYGLLYSHRDDASARTEVDHLIDLLQLRAGRRVLDVGCGAGRHLAAMVERGIDAVGLDLSPDLLAEASQRPALRGRLVRADMRSLPFAGEFDAALSLFTSFGYFNEDAQNTRALAEMARVVKPGGLLAMDLINEPRLRRELSPYDCRRVDGRTIEDHRRIDGRRVVKETAVTDPDGSVHRFCERVRLYDRREITQMFTAAGLVSIRFHGCFAGGECTGESRRMIAVGEKPR